jgi:hypothetical protein
MCEVLLLPDAVVPLLRWALACCLVVVSTTLQRPLVQVREGDPHPLCPPMALFSCCSHRQLAGWTHP